MANVNNENPQDGRIVIVGELTIYTVLELKVKLLDALSATEKLELDSVIKPLGKLFKGEKSIGGFSGEVALIVDVPGLLGRIEDEREVGGMTGAVAAR